jgi:hypothetical protein
MGGARAGFGIGIIRGSPGSRKVTTQVTRRVRTSTGSENHENTKERKHEKTGIPEIKNGTMTR